VQLTALLHGQVKKLQRVPLLAGLVGPTLLPSTHVKPFQPQPDRAMQLGHAVYVLQTSAAAGKASIAQTMRIQAEPMIMVR
jgi:hypothetical protein